MTEKRFIRNIMGNIYDSKNDKWFEEDWKGKPLDYDDDLIVFLNEQHKIIEQAKRYENGLWARFTKLEKENEQLRQEIERLKKELDEKCP